MYCDPGREIICSVCRGTCKCIESFLAEPTNDKAPSAKTRVVAGMGMRETPTLTKGRLMKWITTDVTYESFLRLLHKGDLGLSDFAAMVASSFELSEQQAVVVAEALLASASDVESTIAMKRMLVGTYSHGDFKMGGGYSSSSVMEFQFKADFSYCFQYSYFSGYVSPAYAPVQMSYSSTPNKTEKRGHYVLGRNDLQRSETDVVVRLQDGSLDRLHVKLAGSEAYVGAMKLKRSY